MIDDPEAEKRAWKRKARVEFFENVLDWRKWLEVADELLVAADVLGERVNAHWSRWEKAMEGNDPARFQALWDHPDEKLFTGHNLLLAYVLENLLKALIVKKSPETLAARIFAKRGKDAKQNEEDFFEQEMKLPPPLAGRHDLVRLANEAGFELRGLEQQVLERFTRWVVWSARYPIPTTSREMHDRKIDLHSGDQESVPALIARIRAAIEECPEPAKFNVLEPLEPLK